ncbi:hypothetical protein QYE76_026680 [Lolium multiflorum]|uniref:F-box domain-containing protein n=1 Tax=Lolium multiflorum TaxID=4521 RepID=A0AAD8RKV8_LOLMU|nr:hypothetical protein QYE76_026346 [Lolium multiflorum]KAK1621163.1 hypothetical protein QYE76_026680 [Lolium multiflorum]
METPAACEIDRLSEELLVNVVWLSLMDACHAAAVSWAFRATADSDEVWSGFLPRNLLQFAPEPPAVGQRGAPSHAGAKLH